MAPPLRRHEWHQVSGCWLRRLGERGTRIRLFQKRKGGKFFRDVWVPGHGKSRRCLHTTDRVAAERLGRSLLAELLRGDGPGAATPITLGLLWARYTTEAATYLDNCVTTQQDATTRAKVLRAHFGDACEVASLTLNDAEQYARARLAGGIKYAPGKVTPPVRPRSAAADLVVLKAMIRWGMTVRTATGARLLAFDPLMGMRVPREKNPKQPIASVERFSETRIAMQKLAAEAPTEAERVRWVKLELALVLAEATGRRLGSIRQLRWEDVDFGAPSLRWRAEADKKGKEWCIPIPQALADELRSFQRRLGAVGGWVFASETDGECAMDRHLFDKWLVVAEQWAKLPKLDGSLWHAYRRKWATERKALPLRDVAAAGGWSDVDTLLKVYQQPDRETILRVMSEPRKVSEHRGAAV